MSTVSCGFFSLSRTISHFDPRGTPASGVLFWRGHSVLVTIDCGPHLPHFNSTTPNLTGHLAAIQVIKHSKYLPSSFSPLLAILDAQGKGRRWYHDTASSRRSGAQSTTIKTMLQQERRKTSTTIIHRFGRWREFIFLFCCRKHLDKNVEKNYTNIRRYHRTYVVVVILKFGNFKGMFRKWAVP